MHVLTPVSYVITFRRPRTVPTIRVVVLCPTRELAAQTFANIEQLSSYTDITSALAVGGLSVQVRGQPFGIYDRTGNKELRVKVLL